MTWITDDTGRRWVEVPVRKRRKSPRAVRFAEIKVGDQLMRRWKGYVGEASTVWYYIVTDLWFDPVAGQEDATAGRMVAIRVICPSIGEPREPKAGHTLRGLASQGFQYADIDFATLAKAKVEARLAGDVIGIGHAQTIRRRPKVPGRSL